MKKYLTCFTIAFLMICSVVKAQMANPGPIEQRFTDSLCTSLSKLDMSKITTKAEAVKAYTACVMSHADMLPDLAAERNVDLTDQAAMRVVGIDLAKNLLKQKCNYFAQLSVAMAKKDGDEEPVNNSTSGTIKRMDTKGFNYIVLTDNTGNEKSFIWLRQFPGSENFMDGITKYAGKKVNVKWQEMEVYLPQAKGYYKVKEILAVDILK